MEMHWKIKTMKEHVLIHLMYNLRPLTHLSTIIEKNNEWAHNRAQVWFLHCMERQY